MKRELKSKIDDEFKIQSFLVGEGRFGATCYHKPTNTLGIGFSSDREDAEKKAKEQLILNLAPKKE